MSGLSSGFFSKASWSSLRKVRFPWAYWTNALRKAIGRRPWLELGRHPLRGVDEVVDIGAVDGLDDVDADWGSGDRACPRLHPPGGRWPPWKHLRPPGRRPPGRPRPGVRSCDGRRPAWAELMAPAPPAVSRPGVHLEVLPGHVSQTFLTR